MINYSMVYLQRHTEDILRNGIVHKSVYIKDLVDELNKTHKMSSYDILIRGACKTEVEQMLNFLSDFTRLNFLGIDLLQNIVSYLDTNYIEKYIRSYSCFRSKGTPMYISCYYNSYFSIENLKEFLMEETSLNFFKESDQIVNKIVEYLPINFVLDLPIEIYKYFLLKKNNIESRNIVNTLYYDDAALQRYEDWYDLQNNSHCHRYDLPNNSDDDGDDVIVLQPKFCK